MHFIFHPWYVNGNAVLQSFTLKGWTLCREKTISRLSSFIRVPNPYTEGRKEVSELVRVDLQLEEEIVDEVERDPS